MRRNIYRAYEATEKQGACRRLSIMLHDAKDHARNSGAQFEKRGC